MIGLALPDGPLRVMCLGAHPDDIEIGCGGTLLRLAERGGVTVTGLVATGVAERLEEARGALAAFAPGADLTTWGLPDGRLPEHWGEVKQGLEDLAASIGPVDLVLAPWPGDAHQDHRLLGELAFTVWRDALVLHYEIPKWDGDLGRPSHFVGLTEQHARRKFELLDEHYRSQRNRDWWDEELFDSLLRLRGVECRHRYAEAFYSSKVLVDVGGSVTSEGDA